MEGWQQRGAELFAQGFPPARANGTRRVGLENEYPIVRSSGEAADAAVVDALFGELAQLGFSLRRDAGTGQVIRAERPCGSSENGFAADVVESELGYCTLEVALEPQSDLFTAESCLRTMIATICDCLSRHDHLLLGYGIQPQTPPSRDLVTGKSRFLIYEHRYNNNFLTPEVGTDIHTFTVAAASQCHVDVSREEAMEALNTLGALSGVQLALTANSSVWQGRVDPEYVAVRETFYDVLYDFDGSGTAPPFGILPPFASFADYVGYLGQAVAPMVSRDGESVEVPGDLTVADIVSSETPILGRRLSGEEVLVNPKADEILGLADRLESNVRLAPKYGTLEARVSCQQPAEDALVVPALVLGIVENLHAATELVRELPRSSWQASRLDAARLGLKALTEGRPLSELAQAVVRIAKLGLERRGLGEEVFLQALERRLAIGRIPADDAIDAFDRDGVAGVVERFAIRPGAC